MNDRGWCSICNTHIPSMYPLGFLKTEMVQVVATPYT
jgi:hypothetical protein